MAYLELIQIEKHYDAFHALKNIDLKIEKGEFVVFVGPSGCGKSTLLRTICGLESVTSGKIVLDGRDITYVHPSKRNVAMVFQNYALFPHLNVFDNIAFGLSLQGVSKKDIRRRVERAAALLHLETLLDRKPKQLSGGQRQRVAIGRCIVKQPKLFLFDGPLSNLDAKLRVRMRVELLNLHYDTQNTVVYVTHDQVEAMTMADKIVVLQDGRIEQVGSPMDLYERPVNKFVEGFIGSPQMNFLDGRVTGASSSGISLMIEGIGKLELPLIAESVSTDRVLTVGVRPEDAELDGAYGKVLVPGIVNIVENLGGETYLHVEVAPQIPLVTVKLHGSRNPGRGGRVKLYFPPDKIHLFDADGSAVPAIDKAGSEPKER
ncbi:MAG: ABC transporter ATP-binding protein [Verrucomicrobia bacterium]|nr:ABC transporter ATP-binding protein [Verrucomicrobiota bacterium]